MKKWFVHITPPIVGYDGYSTVFADTFDEAVDAAYYEATIHLEQFFDVYEDEEDYNDEYGVWGVDYLFISDVDFVVEEYINDLHKDYFEF
jgi:hypothetical protein